MKCNTSRLVPWRSLDHAQNFEATEGNSYKDSTIAGEVEDGSRRLGPSGDGGGDRRRGCLTGVGKKGNPVQMVYLKLQKKTNYQVVQKIFPRCKRYEEHS